MTNKRIIYCCDGTWNEPGDQTNIHWLFQNVDHDGDSQIVGYDAGVGTKWHDKKIGGAFGVGLSHNVRQAYRFLLDYYKPGDEIYLFGFSRGAYTVRSLCGFMQFAGQLADKNEISEAYFYYRLQNPDIEDERHHFVKHAPKSLGPMPVKFLGVFDTVGALGIPFEIKDRLEDEDDSRSSFARFRDKARDLADKTGDRLRRPIKGFHNTRLGEIVEHGYHALAIDERRKVFLPCLWTSEPGEAVQLDAQRRVKKVPQHVEQVWFAGVHSDIGGGYNDIDEHGKPLSRLADIPLLWMSEKAMATGLQFKDSAVAKLEQGIDISACQHESLTEKWRRLGEIDRPLNNNTRITINPAGDLFPLVHTTESVHNSAQQRVGKTVRIFTGSGQFDDVRYDPLNLR